MAREGDTRWELPSDLKGLRILAFSDWYTPQASGGAERAAWEVYRRLGRAGAEVRVVSAAHGRPHADEGVSVRCLRAVDLSRVVGGYFAPTPSAFSIARKELRRFRPHALHASTLHYTGCIAAAWLAGRSGVPLVTTVQLAAATKMPFLTRHLAGGYDRTVGRFILRRSSRVLVVSEAVRRYVMGLGVPSDRTRLAPNGVDHERFAVGSRSPGDPPSLILVGRLMTNKGPQLLVEAAGRLRRRDIVFRLVLVGDGPLRLDLENRCRELGLHGIVTFAGHVEHPEDWYREADIVVRPSFTEGLPLSVIEAMAAGRCNVVSDIEPNRELIRDGENGYTFRCGDIEHLTEVLHRAITTPTERDRLARQGHIDSLEYSWDRMAAVSGQALLEVAALSRPARGEP